MSYFFTSESVSNGHPDKICDRLSDMLLDMYLTLDPDALVAVETMVTEDRVIMTGEIKSIAHIEEEVIKENIRQNIKEIGYDQPGFNWRTLNIELFFKKQSEDINKGVQRGRNKRTGAGDQGIMFGYATDTTIAFMPDAIYYSNQLMKKIAEHRESGIAPELGPDGKCQITMHYNNGNHKPDYIDKVLISNQHSAGVSLNRLREILIPIVQSVLPKDIPFNYDNLLINPTGRFVAGGPKADAGLTGRKIIVDTYGGYAPHGGGAFSGKDPTKVDRSAAYFARYLAKNIIASGIAQRCTIQLSYAIGIPDPQSIFINFHNTSKGVSEQTVINHIMKNIDMSPDGIISTLKLKNPIYKATSSFGHFGRDPRKDGCFSWERLDMIDLFKKII